jgi:cell wall-associated NlpC family hydrolase
MLYQGAIEISGRGLKRAWRGAGALACALAIAALIALSGTGFVGPASAGAAPAPGSSTAASSSSGLGALGDTVLKALGAARAEKALDAIGHGLALMEAQKRIAATERKLAREEAAAAQAEPEPTLTADEEVKDPSEMPPASAGTNGSVDPSKVKSTGLFAHTRPGDDASTAILLSGIALPPPDAPEAVQQVINAANTIVGRPYVWGGGHASFTSYGYDCSGSVSFVLHGAALIPEPLTSGSLEGWGEPGPGKWITVYANADHTFMEIDGLRWDTVGDARGTGPRWHLMPTSTAGFVARHPPGL